MNNTFLGEDEYTTTYQKGSALKYQLKIQHLNLLSKKFYTQNEQFKKKIINLQEINKSISNNQESENMTIRNLSIQILEIKVKNQTLSKQNQQLLSTILLNEQLGIQARKQSQFYLGRYEQKITQLRQSLQIKQIQIQIIQDKLQRYKGLQLPMNSKNANRYIVQILKYETLISEMIREMNRTKCRDIVQIKSVMMSLGKQYRPVGNINEKKIKSTKMIGSSCTDVRPNKQNLDTQSDVFEPLNNQKIQVLFLRLHLQLREIKKQYRERLQEIAQSKAKDKIMKQGYHTITKQIQRVRVQNCQLKIQLQHMDKKIKTTNEFSRIKSVGNIKRNFGFKQNAQGKFPSEVSIECNISDDKNCAKVTLSSQTKPDTFSAVNKSHMFDQKIQNILSQDYSSQFKNKQKKQINENQQDQQLSVCQQNEVDLSISLDASGFLPSEKSHHQVSEHILIGLIDRKIF